MQEAMFYHKVAGNAVECNLCPHNCRIREGKPGICKVRFNFGGELVTMAYNQVAAIHVDPIEKKPLYHFYPGKNILSIGETGCNFQCSFCQNYSISQCSPENFSGFVNLSSAQIIEKAVNLTDNIGIAYTYNEPFTFYEFMFDCAKLAHSRGLLNVVVSNGFVNSEPLKKILPFIDAFNIDLKAFNNEFYKKLVKGKLQPVLESLKIIAHSGKHLEITNLVIPDKNDNITEFEEMVKWISDEAGPDRPLHLSRYYPAFKMDTPPTPSHSLEKFYNIASRHLNYVYLGNVADPERSSTYCPRCSALLIKRDHYTPILNIKGKSCPECGYPVNIIMNT